MRMSGRATVAGAITVTLLGSGAAFAYWSSGASQSVEVPVASGGVLTVDPPTTPDLPLRPGTTQGWYATLHNASDHDISVDTTHSSIKIDPKFSSQTSADLPACTPADFELSQRYLPGSVTAGTTNYAYIRIALINKPRFSDAGVDIPLNNQDNCRGVKVPLIFDIYEAS